MAHSNFFTARRLEWAFYRENTMTNDDIRKQLEDAKAFIDDALKALDNDDRHEFLGALTTASLLVDGVIEADEEDEE